MLSFQTITIRLKFGDDYEAENLPSNAQATRVKGAELFDGTNTVCGEIYLDDLKTWKAREQVECVLLSWCLQPPLAGIADPLHQPEDLLWIMFITWEHGIAERRGIGKISASAVKNSLVPAVVKPILLA